jgi:hypothetical protein
MDGAAWTIVSVIIVLWIWLGDDIMAIVNRMTGQPKGLTKKQAKKLQREHTEALDILREIDAYDRYAVNPLPTGIHDRLGKFLNEHKGTAALPSPEDS